MAEYLKNAPKNLIKYYENETFRKGRKYLLRLLKGTPNTKTELDRAWKILSKNIKTEHDESRLWLQISHAIQQSRKRNVSRTEKREYFEKISKDAISLKKKLEGKELDKLLFEYFSDDDMLINEIPNWQDLSSDERQEAASGIIYHWPSITDVLQELSDRSAKISNIAMTEERVTERNRSKSKGDIDYSTFIRILYEYLERISGQGHAAPVAYITNALFDTEYSNRDIEKRLKK